MIAEQLRAVREAQPFRPFIICLADGRTLSVPTETLCRNHPVGGPSSFIGRANHSASLTYSW
jgi:hypothetical protein